MASKMLSMESPTGRTKHAESWPSSFAAGVHQGRRIGHEVQGGHHAVEILLQGLQVDTGPEPGLRGGDGPGHAAEHLLRLLQNGAFLIALEIAALENGDCVFGKGGQRRFFNLSHGS
jgi:hypothetical protein